MKAKVIANGVRLHKSSSVYSDAVGFAECGSELDIEAEYGEWCKLTDGRWVEAAYTEPIDTGTSWNDLADKPFGIIEHKYPEVENATYDYKVHEGKGNPQTGQISESDPHFVRLFEGRTYIVEWDGVPYECVAVGSAYGGAALGNMSLQYGIDAPPAGFGIYSDDTGEPFAIFEVEYETFFTQCFATTEGEHTYSIYEYEEEIERLDGNFLPWLQITNVGDSHIANMTYEEAYKSIGGGALLGGCYNDYPNKTVYPFVKIKRGSRAISCYYYDANGGQPYIYFAEDGDIEYRGGVE